MSGFSRTKESKELLDPDMLHVVSAWDGWKEEHCVLEDVEGLMTWVCIPKSG